MATRESKNILVVGDIMLDRYHIGDHTRQSPEADVPLIEQKQIDDRLGGAGNVACNLKSLGLSPILVSVIGDDEVGRVIEQLCSQKFETYHLKTLSDRPSTLKSRIVDQEFKQYLRLDREVTTDLSLQDQHFIENQIIEILENQDIQVIVIQDYNKGLLTEGIITKIQALSRDLDIPLVVDPKKKHFSLLSNCTVFKPNLKELSQAVGYKIPPNKEHISLAISDLGLIDTQSISIIVTMAENGLFYADQNSGVKGVINGQNIIDPDVSGAGDTVLATLVHSLIAGFSIKKMAEIANTAGAAVCRKKGIEVITLNELKA